MKWLRMLVLVPLLLLSSLAWAGPVNINTAGAQELAANIRGVGVKRAQAIIDYRKEHGLFKSVDEMTQVRGIGIALIERNRDNLTVGNGH